MFRKIIKATHYFKLFVLMIVMCGFAVSAAMNPVRVFDYLGSGFSKAIGVSSSVKPNPYNTLALQLEEKESRLYEQELDLKKRESAFDEKLNKQQVMIYALSGIVFLLVFLIGSNFYFDYRRKNKQSEKWVGQK